MANLRSASDVVKLEAARYRILKDRLLDQFPGIDDETLSNTLEGINDLREMLAELVRSALEDEALLSGLSTRLTEMRARVQRLEYRADKKRELARRVMAEAEIRTLVEPDFTASLRQGAPPLEIVAEELIPEPFWKPQAPKLDRLALLAALRGGVKIDGVRLGPVQLQLNLRTK
jgi:Siphovirus Gp157